MMTKNAISRLLKPRSVAIIGASTDSRKTAGRPVAYLRKHGFAGNIYPVNPRVENIGGLPCYPDIASIPEVPDVGIVLLGADRAQSAVAELAQRGTAAAIVLASGYTETGEEGARRQIQLIEAAGCMRILGPNTIGLVNLTDNIVLSASGALEMEHLPVGTIGVVSQSGGILGSLLSRAVPRGIGLSKLISTSNEVDLDLADFIDYLADDEATKIIALYVESVRNPNKFMAAALKAARAGKPVVAFKIGRSEAGAKAAVSHTGALAGSDRMYDALFKQVGIIRAQNFGDLLDIPAGLVTGRKLLGNRVAILTSTGGAGTLVSDNLGVSGFETPAPDADTAAKLRALETGDHAALDRNPIDVTLAGLQPDLLRGAIRTLLASPGYDALIIIVGSSSLAMPELMASAIQDCLPESDKPVIAYVSPHAPDVAALLTQRGVPAFSAVESCTVALAGMLEHTHWRAPSSLAPCEPIDMTGLPTGSLDEAQAKQLFTRFGIPCTSETVVTSPNEAEQAASVFGHPVALKILSGEITHKSDVGGVAINIKGGQIAARLTAMRAEVHNKTGFMPRRFLVQEMVTGGTELILGMHRDPLGTAILLGMGGVTAELFKDTTMRLVAPNSYGLHPEVATDMVRSLKTWPLLDGFRGRPKADVGSLVSAIVAFSQMAVQLGDQLLEAEINPLFVLPAGQGVLAADGVAVLTNAP